MTVLLHALRHGARSSVPRQRAARHGHPGWQRATRPSRSEVVEAAEEENSSPEETQAKVEEQDQEQGQGATRPNLRQRREHMGWRQVVAHNTVRRGTATISRGVTAAACENIQTNQATLRRRTIGGARTQQRNSSASLERNKFTYIILCWTVPVSQGPARRARLPTALTGSSPGCLQSTKRASRADLRVPLRRRHLHK